MIRKRSTVHFSVSTYLDKWGREWRKESSRSRNFANFRRLLFRSLYRRNAASVGCNGPPPPRLSAPRNSKIAFASWHRHSHFPTQRRTMNFSLREREFSAGRLVHTCSTREITEKFRKSRVFFFLLRSSCARLSPLSPLGKAIIAKRRDKNFNCYNIVVRLLSCIQIIFKWHRRNVTYISQASIQNGRNAKI